MRYQDIFTIKSLNQSHNKTKKGKLHKKEVAEFELNKASEIYKLCEELKSKNYKTSPYRTFYIYEPKKRKVDAISYRDRIVQNCFVDNYLFPLLEKRLIFDNAACRKNKGTDFARKRLKRFLTEEYRKNGLRFYVFVFDIHHYFESIDHTVLKGKLEKIIKDEEIKEFAFSIIDSFNEKSGKGIPLGNQTSQCFALYYLDSFDRIIKEKYRVKHYSRYMDDGIVLSSDKESLMNLKRDLGKELSQLKLTFNEKKCAIYPIKQGISYLGFTYRLSINGKIICKMEKKKKRRLIHHLNKHELKPDSLLSYRNYLKKKSNNFALIRNIEKLMKQ